MYDFKQIYRKNNKIFKKINQIQKRLLTTTMTMIFLFVNKETCALTIFAKQIEKSFQQDNKCNAPNALLLLAK